MRRMHPMCVTCLIRKQQEAVDGLVPAQVGLEYMQRITELVARHCLQDSPSLLFYRTIPVTQEFFGAEDRFAAAKRAFNDLVLKHRASIEQKISSADDKLLFALLLSLTGNYIDVGTVDNITEDGLASIMYDFNRLNCDTAVYPQLKDELEHCRRLAFLHDNAGEIVLDKLLIQVIRELYPKIEITSIVRGAPVLNDALMEDALYIGLDSVCSVIDNGTAIPGTEPEYLSEQAREAFDGADVIISKGQGNFETLCGCGRPVYYLFLSKCPLQCRRFGVAPLTGMMLREDGRTLFDTVE